jgi:beta-lactam-binding protein with PASTA domain
MSDDDYDVPGLPKQRPPKGPGMFAVISTSIVTSVLASVATVFALSKMPSSPLAGATARDLGGSAPIADSGLGAVTVPDLVRVPRENVRSIVEAVGLRFIESERHEQSAVPAGLVAAQAPRAGTSVPRGSDLVVVISAGPGESDSGVAPPVNTAVAPVATQDTADAGALSADSVAVPSVYRLYVREARSRLSLAGLSLGEERRGGYDEDVSPGRILRQSPTAGTRVARGAVVHVYVNQE